MKLFHKENEKETVYVQMEDIMYLKQIDMPMPATIFLKVFGEIHFINDSNRFDFVRFDEEHEVKFFKELEFVIDYNQYKDLTNKQLEEKAKELVEKLNETSKKWSAMTPEERMRNGDVFREHENLEYMLNFLSNIYSMEDWKRFMPFPDFVELPEKPKKKPFFKRKKYVK